MTETTADSTQKKQNAWILNTISPISARLNTAMESDATNSPHQVRRESSVLFSASPGSRGTMAITSTAR